MSARPDTQWTTLFKRWRGGSSKSSGSGTIVEQLRISSIHNDMYRIIFRDLPALLRKINEAMIGLGGVFPIGGIRSRAIRLDCYRMADVFVFSSLTETQGLVLLEAMAQAVPVVAIAEMGTRSILREGDGALIAPHDEQQFAQRVQGLLADRDYRKALGEKAHGYALHWSARNMTQRMVDFYQRVLTASPIVVRRERPLPVQQAR